MARRRLQRIPLYVLRCLTDERIAYADGWFAETHDDTASITLDGFAIRAAAHLADLSKFGVVDGTTLTCNLHGWQWNLVTGRCLTSKATSCEAHGYERAAPVLRRRPDPARPRGAHAAPLPLSVRHVRPFRCAPFADTASRWAYGCSGSGSGAARICAAGCRWMRAGR